MTLTATIRAAISAIETNPGDLAPDAKAPIDLSVVLNLTNGSGSGQALKIFADSRTVTASGSDNLDLSGALSSAFGATIAFATIKAIFIRSRDANTTTVEFFGTVANAFSGVLKDSTDVIVVRPGGLFQWVAPQAGVTVTAGTADILKVTNGGAADATYDIVIIGT